MGPSPISTIVSIVGITLAFVSALVAVVSSVVLLKYRTEYMERTAAEMKQSIQELRGELRAATEAMMAAAAMLKTFQAEQLVINRVTETTIRSLVDKIERHERQLAELEAIRKTGGD